MPRGEADRIIGQIGDATLDLVHRNIGLVQRVAAGSSDHPDSTDGPAQEIWKVWTESAGDLVQISYLTAQLVDSLWRDGRSR